MIHLFKSTLISGLFLGMASASSAFALPATATNYVLTFINGSKMPLSPISVYVVNGQPGKTVVGQAPSPGFIQLCQTGDPTLRVHELSGKKDVTFKAQTTGMLMPGESRSITVHVQDPLQQSIQFESMYGKTKDSCAVGAIGNQSLYALKLHATTEFFGRDHVLQTGAFLDPALPMGSTYQDANLCAGQMDGVSCLRVLAASATQAAQVRYFTPYLASVQLLLETKFGATDTQTLIIPSSGAVEYSLKLAN